MSNSITFKRTGEACYFGNISIGSLFFAHGKFWVRTGRSDASKLEPSVGNNSRMQGACNFIIDGRSIEDAGNDELNDHGHKTGFGSTNYGEKVERVEFV